MTSDFSKKIQSVSYSPKVFHFSALEEKRVGEFFMGELEW